MKSPFDEPSIELNASTAFQLLIFAPSASVRDAAATALEPAIRANPLLLEHHGKSMGALPRSERVAALLVASLVEQDPACATRWGVLPPSATDASRRFRYAFARAGTRQVDPIGFEQVMWTRASFELPRKPEAMHTRLATAIVRRPDARAAAPIGWRIDASGARLQLPWKRYTRATCWSRPSLVTPEGRLHSTLDCDAESVMNQRVLPLSPSFLLRLQSGALRGFLVTIVHRARYARPDRARDAVLSIELGASLDDPPIVAMHRGELCPRYDLSRLMQQRTVTLPQLGGSTMHSLDVIARQTGVWHGDFLRASFEYHPVRWPNERPRTAATEAA
jgi:hypothetical protein